uniref:Uncharacterized protein n=1 Tax=Arundo donax TaxID=35708 RepID=A0A0A8YYB8_ARUDO
MTPPPSLCHPTAPSPAASTRWPPTPSPSPSGSPGRPTRPWPGRPTATLR